MPWTSVSNETLGPTEPVQSERLQRHGPLARALLPVRLHCSLVVRNYRLQTVKQRDTCVARLDRVQGTILRACAAVEETKLQLQTV